jgi:hypothetical protein
MHHGDGKKPLYIVKVMILEDQWLVRFEQSTHPSITNASTVRPSAVPDRSLATSSPDPKVAKSNPASLTLATRLGTAAYVVSADRSLGKHDSRA